MKHAKRVMTFCAAVCSVAALSACRGDGDFCGVYQPVGPLPESVVDPLIADARGAAEAIYTNELSYKEECR